MECFVKKKKKIDNIIILSDEMLSNNNFKISTILNDYKNTLNQNLKIFSIDLVGYGKEINLSDEFNE